MTGGQGIHTGELPGQPAAVASQTHPDSPAYDERADALGHDRRGAETQVPTATLAPNDNRLAQNGHMGRLTVDERVIEALRALGRSAFVTSPMS